MRTKWECVALWKKGSGVFREEDFLIQGGDSLKIKYGGVGNGKEKQVCIDNEGRC